MILKRGLKPRVFLDLTPLIDVVFQLVVFFMISSVFNTTPGIELALPDSSTSEAVEVSEIRITVVGKNEVYLNRELIPLLSLGETLMEWKTTGRFTENTSVLIEGDSNVPYETIITVLDEVREGGIENVNLVTAPIPVEQ